jgi:thiol:disulfide interchange protein DsbC
MKSLQILSVFFLAIFLSTTCIAADVSEQARQNILAMFEGSGEIEIESFDGQLLEITVGPRTLFASPDGQYIFSGTVLDTKTGINLVEQKAKQYRQRRLLELAPDMYLSFPSTTDEQYAVTVFTDIDCTYCRRFHLAMPEFNELGITVNYVMLPRAGLNSSSYNKAASVFCSSQPAENMTLAMRDEFDQENSCEHTITNQFKLASELGINSTPTIILPDGEVRPGYLTPTALQAVLESD